MTVEGSRMHPIWMRLSTSNMETQYFKLCHYITVYAKGSIVQFDDRGEVAGFVLYGLDTGTVLWALK